MKFIIGIDTMVFFNCEECGEAMRKGQVKRHIVKCLSDGFSCIDCQTMFTSITYNDHIKCISENEKYGAADYVEKPKKGEIKQNSWIEQVNRAIENVSADDSRLKDVLHRVRKYTNIPRKQAKFINFLRNSIGVKQDSLCIRAWNAIQDELKTTDNDNDKTEEENGHASDMTTPVNAKKVNKNVTPSKKEDRLLSVNNNDEMKKVTHSEVTASEEDANFDAQDDKRFKWKSAIKRKLRDNEGSMKFKRLRREIIADYIDAVTDTDQNEEKLNDYFAERLASINRVVIEGKMVSLK